MVTFIKSPSIIEAAGNKPKIIEEFIGRVNSKTEVVSIESSWPRLTEKESSYGREETGVVWKKDSEELLISIQIAGSRRSRKRQLYL